MLIELLKSFETVHWIYL